MRLGLISSNIIVSDPHVVERGEDPLVEGWIAPKKVIKKATQSTISGTAMKKVLAEGNGCLVQFL